MNLHTGRSLSIIILAIFISLSFIHFFGNYSLVIEGLEFNVDTSLAYRGVTQIEIPPLGLVRANTHRTPVKLAVRLNSLNLDRVQQVLENSPNREEIFRRVGDNLRRETHRYVAELILTAGAAGLFAALLLHSAKIADYLKGMLAAIAVVGMLLTATYYDFDADRFSNPEFEGVLKAAPWMIGIAEEAIAKIDSLGNKLQLVATNLNELYRQIDNLQPLQTTEGNIKVLHVSDIHNNPAAIQFIGRMAELFAVNFIIDTGDISDFGTPLEGLLLDRVRELNVPYLFIAGNHDSPVIIQRLKSLKSNVIVTEGPVELSGIKVMGFHDPASSTNEITPPPPGLISGHIEYIKKALNEELNKSEKPIDIIAVHSPDIARPLAGRAPVMVFGHNHIFEVSSFNDSVLINAGTSGASGLGTLQEVARRPYSVMLLHFNKDNTGTSLLAVDSIQIDSTTAEFSMQRHIFNGTEQIKTDNPAEETEARNKLKYYSGNI